MGGTDKIVEIDEALMGKKHGWLKHGNNNKTMKVWVVGFAERLGTEEKSMRFRVVKNRSKTNLHNLIKETVNKKSIAFTDGWDTTVCKVRM